MKNPIRKRNRKRHDHPLSFSFDYRKSWVWRCDDCGEESSLGYRTRKQAKDNYWRHRRICGTGCHC